MKGLMERIFSGILYPLMKTSPLVGKMSPVKILKVVVFPAPLVPNKLIISP